jgi:hypothetical protein
MCLIHGASRVTCTTVLLSGLCRRCHHLRGALACLLCEYATIVERGNRRGIAKRPRGKLIGSEHGWVPQVAKLEKVEHDEATFEVSLARPEGGREARGADFAGRPGHPERGQGGGVMMRGGACLVPSFASRRDAPLSPCVQLSRSRRLAARFHLDVDDPVGVGRTQAERTCAAAAAGGTREEEEGGRGPTWEEEEEGGRGPTWGRAWMVGGGVGTAVALPTAAAAAAAVIAVRSLCITQRAV